MSYFSIKTYILGTQLDEVLLPATKHQHRVYTSQDENLEITLLSRMKWDQLFGQVEHGISTPLNYQPDSVVLLNPNTSIQSLYNIMFGVHRNVPCYM